jgi:soluble lytic murein transglycosylase
MAASLIVFLGSALGIGAATAVGVPEEPSTTAAPSVPSFPSQARLRFLSALATLRSEDWSAAAREFGDRSWADTPLSEYARLYEAESRLKAGDNVAARAAMLRSAEIMAEGRLAPSALLEAATLLQAAGEDATAVTLVRRFLDRHRDHAEAPRARLLLGQSLLAQGLVSDAARAFNDLRILSPAAPETAVASEQLRVLIEQGLGGPPPSPRERIERAERLLAAGFGEAAKSEAEELLTDGLPPELAGRALKIVFDVARRGGRYEAALAVVKRALSSLSPTRRPGWLLELARLQQRRSVEQALTTLDRLGREYSKSFEAGEALLLKARLLEDAGRLGQARAAYAKLAAEYSEHDDAGVALWRLGWLAWFRTAYAEAGGTWARLLTIPGGHAYHESAKYWIGRAYDQRGDAGAAARHFAELVAEAPRSYYGILAAQRGGRAPSPRVASPVVLPTDPFEPLQAHPSYVRVEALRAVALGDFADEELAEMTRRAVGEPELLYGLAAAFVRESRYHLALRILRRHFFSLARSGFDATPRAFWEIFYPIGWRGELMEAASRAALDPFFVAAVVREESSFYPRARSRVGARGLMQLMPDTARRLAVSRRLTLDDPDRLDDPATNLELGTTYLAGLVREFGDPRLAAAAYNAGPTRVREWWSARRSEDLEVFVEQIPFNETRAFVKRVILAWDEYHRLYGAPITIERADARPRSVAP